MRSLCEEGVVLVVRGPGARIVEEVGIGDLLVGVVGAPIAAEETSNEADESQENGQGCGQGKGIGCRGGNVLRGRGAGGASDAVGGSDGHRRVLRGAGDGPRLSAAETTESAAQLRLARLAGGALVGASSRAAKARGMAGRAARDVGELSLRASLG